MDVKLKSFDAASKIKIIKAVRSVTNLGLKEVCVVFALQARALESPRLPCVGQGSGRERTLQHSHWHQAGRGAQDRGEAQGGGACRV